MRLAPRCRFEAYSGARLTPVSMKWWHATHQGQRPVSAEPAGRSTARTLPATRHLAHVHFGLFATTACIDCSQSSHILGRTSAAEK
jgi:hypothetical protein